MPLLHDHEELAFIGLARADRFDIVQNFDNFRTQRSEIIHEPMKAAQEAALYFATNENMKASTRYVKIVEWSDEDQCYVGSCPGLFYGGCHGDNEQDVFNELCDIVDETVELYQQTHQPLPPPTGGKDYANKMLGIA